MHILRDFLFFQKIFHFCHFCHVDARPHNQRLKYVSLARQKGDGSVATRKDIAQRAGVSISVVSRALNNSGYVDAEKKKKISDSVLLQRTGECLQH